jgi:hypothetical protein
MPTRLPRAETSSKPTPPSMATGTSRNVAVRAWCACIQRSSQYRPPAVTAARLKRSTRVRSASSGSHPSRRSSLTRVAVESEHYMDSTTFASCRSVVSKPSVNQE